MGQTLSKAAQWSSSSSSRDKLESTPLLPRVHSTPESLLKEILDFVEKFGSKYPQEAEHVFEEPLQWKSTLVASDFQTGFDIRDSAVQSHEKDSEGQPLLQLSPPSVSVANFSQLSKLLHLAGNRKLQEIRACLEENRDPMVKIFGRSFISKLERTDSPAEVLSPTATSEEDQSAVELDVKVKLFNLLQNIDKQILNKLLGEITEQVKLDPTAVKKEVELLKQCCSEGEKRLLKSLRYTSDFEFPNGCRAPLWRQALGEMSHLVVEPCDTETLFITCSSAGVFLNAGFKQEGDESHYERKGDLYEDLASLLKSRSPHFAENFNKQVLVEPEPPSAQGVHGADLVGGEEQGRPQKSEEQQENDVHDWERVQRALYRRKEYKTCQRWRDLGGLLTIFGKTSATYEEHVSKSFPESEEQEEEEEEEEEEEQQVRRSETNTDMPSEDWYIEKLVQDLKDGDQTATVLVLCSMMELDLLKESYQVAIQDLGGLEVLLNLLDTDDIRCKIGSLKILTKISQNAQLRQTIVKMRGLQRMVNNLDLPVKELQALAAETIKNVATSRRARRIVREHGGIGKLVKLLECFPNPAERRANMEEDLEVARCAASALWICSKSTKNKEAIRNAGGIPLLGRMLRSPLENMLVPVVGTLQECASQEAYRAAIQSEGMVKVFVKKLRSNNTELQMLCASAIFKCAEDEGTRDLVCRSRGLQPLVSLLAKADNKQLLAAATGAIWKCSLSMENVAIFQENNVLQILIGLLTDQPEEVLVNVVGALGQFAQIPANTTTICRGGSIKILINLLKGKNQALLVNVAKAVGACATVKDNVVILYVLDGIRLLWSLLQNPSAEVQCSAAWALCPCIGNAKNAEIMALSLIGGLELVVNLLKSTNNQVLTSVCALVAKLAKHKKIVEVLSERGAVPLLTRLTDTTDNRLRCYLAEAIEHLCLWSTNRESFGECGAVGPLVRYLKSKDSGVLLSATMALYELSKELNNIITMHKEGAVPRLIRLMGSDDHKLQEFAAGCLRNIRLLARANQRAAR